MRNNIIPANVVRITLAADNVSKASGIKWKRAPPISEPVANDTKKMTIFDKDSFERKYEKTPVNPKSPSIAVAAMIQPKVFILFLHNYFMFPAHDIINATELQIIFD